MNSTHNTHSPTIDRRLLACALTLLLFLTFRPAIAAARSQYYDMDSLCHLSTDIVEGTIVGPAARKKFGGFDVEITYVHKGFWSPGQTATIAKLRDHHKLTGSPPQQKSLEIGDRLVLFLEVRSSETLDNLGEVTAVSLPSHGGVRIVHDGRVINFNYITGPGPDVAALGDAAALGKLPTIEAFREQIRQGLRNADALNQLVDAPSDELDVERLLELLKERKPADDVWGARDHFLSVAGQRLGETLDPELLSRALTVTGMDSARSIYRGFHTPRGREFLLAKLEDVATPLRKREHYAAVLSQAGVHDRTIVAGRGDKFWQDAAAIGDVEPDAMPRVVRLIRRYGSHEGLCRELISLITGFVPANPLQVSTERRAALDELKVFYATKPSAWIQYSIENALSHSRWAYAELNSSCGDMLSLVELPRGVPQPVDGKSLRLQYVFLNRNALDADRQALVFKNTATGATHAIDVGWKLIGGSSVSGTETVELSKDLPAGKYEVYLQLWRKERVVSRGHGFEIKLSPAAN